MDIRDFLQTGKNDDFQVTHAASLSYNFERVLNGLYFIVKNLPDVMLNNMRSAGYEDSFRNGTYNSKASEFASSCQSVYYEAEALVTGFNQLASQNRNLQERLALLEGVVLAILDESAKDNLIKYLHDNTKTDNLKIVELVAKINQISR